MNKIFNRSISLLGDDVFSNISSKTLLICGLGGVGGTALESLLRTGINSFVLVDFDVVDETNLNRQILFNQSDIGKLKVDAAKEHILSINPNSKVKIHNIKINKDNASLLLNNVDFVCDCIDDIPAKVALISECGKNNIPFICSLGMANRFDPSLVNIKKLNQTTNDPLARKLRHELKENNVDLSKVYVVHSSETPVSGGSELSSIMTVPSSAGLNIAYFVISYFRNK